MRKSRLSAVLAAGQRHLATTGDNEASQAAAGLGTALENEFDARDGKIADLEEQLAEVASAKERLEEQGDKIKGLEERLAEVALAIQSEAEKKVILEGRTANKIKGLEERLAEVALAIQSEAQKKVILEERMANLLEKLLDRVQLLESEKRFRSGGGGSGGGGASSSSNNLYSTK